MDRAYAEYVHKKHGPVLPSAQLQPAANTTLQNDPAPEKEPRYKSASLKPTMPDIADICPGSKYEPQFVHRARHPYCNGADRLFDSKPEDRSGPRAAIRAQSTESRRVPAAVLRERGATALAYANA